MVLHRMCRGPLSRSQAVRPRAGLSPAHVMLTRSPGWGRGGNGAAPTAGGGSQSPGLRLPLHQALAVPGSLLAFLGSGAPRRSGFLLR